MAWVEEGLELLLRALEALNRGAFLFVVCGTGEWREELMARLEEELASQGRRVWREVVSPKQPDLAERLEKQRDSWPNAFRPVVFVDVKGLELAGLRGLSSREVELEEALKALSALNYQRERLSRLGLPIVFWLSWEALSLVIQHAGDLFAARSGLFSLEKIFVPGYPTLEEKLVFQWAMERPSIALLPPKELKRRISFFKKLLLEEREIPRLALFYGVVAELYRALGEWDEALKYQEQALEHYRFLAQRDPQAFLPALAASLNNLGAMLSALGRREEALKATEEAVEIRRKLAQENPKAFLPELAMSLNNLGIMLSDLGRREEALKATEEAVEISRKLAQENPKAFLPDLAASLTNLGLRLSELGRWKEALEATEEAVEIRRKLAQENPKAFLPDLARSLNNLGLALSELGRREEALEATEEALGIYRELARSNPQAFSPDLARSLGVHGSALLGLGRVQEARESFAEGLRIVLPFARTIPATFGKLASALWEGYLKACRETGEKPEEELLEEFSKSME